MYSKVPTNVNFVEREREVLRFWQVLTPWKPVMFPHLPSSVNVPTARA